MPSTHTKSREPSYRYIIRNRTTLDEYLKSHSPICYSCHDNVDLIEHFSVINEHTNEETFVCIDCLDLCTSTRCSFSPYDVDWTQRKYLNRLRAYHCAFDGDFFITAFPGQRYRLDTNDPSYNHHYS